MKHVEAIRSFRLKLTIKGCGILGSAMTIKVYPEIFLTCLHASHIVADHRSS